MRMDIRRRSASSWIFVLSVCSVVHGQTVQNAKDLRTQLFTTNAYDYRVRPVANQTTALNVTVEFILLTVNGLDEVEGTLKTTGYLSVKWIDNELTWTPATYGGLTSFFVPQNEIWKPDIALKNSFSDYKPLGVSQLNIEVSNDGTVEWFPFQVFTSTCSVDITYFPFDVQICNLDFVAWSYGKDEVYLWSTNGVMLSEYEENPSWELVETDFSEEHTSEDAVIRFSIKLRRKELYAMISVVFPILVLSVLDLFVFVLPCESGEKSGYAVTVFLTFAVFLTIISATMPENSTSIPVFSIYVILMTTQSTVITMIALTLVRCSTFDESVTPIPNWVITLVKLGKCKPCRKMASANKVDHVEAEDTKTPKKTDLDLTIDSAETAYTWKHVVNGLDAVFFLLFSIITVLITTLCFAISAGVADTE